MPKKHRRLSHDDSIARGLAIVACRLSGMTTAQIAHSFKLTCGRVTQILHSVAGQLAPRKFKG